MEKNMLNTPDNLLPKLAKYTLVFLFTTGAQYVLNIWLLKIFRKAQWLATALSSAVFLVCEFWLHRRVTFYSNGKLLPAIIKFVGFCLLFVCGYFAFAQLSSNRYILVSIFIFVFYVAQYLFLRFVVYGNSVDSRQSIPLENIRGTGLLFKLICVLTKLFYGKVKLCGKENIPDEPCIIVANHAKANGPIVAQLYYPRKRVIWTTWQMMDKNAVGNYCYRDFWGQKPKSSAWFYKILSWLISPFCVYFFRRAETVAVYKDGRLRKTLQDTLSALNDGKDVLIFPEDYQPYNHIVNNFQEGFVDVAQLYYKRFGKRIKFVPTYVCASLRICIFGKAISYDETLSAEQQRKVVCSHVKEEITRLALQLPSHKIVPYENVKKRQYKSSK